MEWFKEYAKKIFTDYAVAQQNFNNNPFNKDLEKSYISAWGEVVNCVANYKKLKNYL